MNIKAAKEQIKNAVQAYFTKDKYGEYVISIEKQRPVFLIGPPGIGKTAIMEQIASELGIGLVSYTMTHHTRQSALGLPFIEKRVFDGKEYSVSEYTMSEIIASVYDQMEITGLNEGILFLDEINCVSETLAPSMLQFLQYKTFGRHKVPSGWIVVTAGNPPEYNNSVREFDIVTWDRLKRVDVDPDYDVWKEYAVNSGVHASIMTYLDIKSENFYRVETTVDGKKFVTARGWSDLSAMICLYEKNGIEVTFDLIAQYLQHDKIAHDFEAYYDLWKKYRSDYQVDNILQGKEDSEIVKRAQSADFDERLMLVGLLLDCIRSETEDLYEVENGLSDLINDLQVLRVCSNDRIQENLLDLIEKKETLLVRERTINTTNMNSSLHYSISFLREMYESLIKASHEKEPFELIKKHFDSRISSLETEAKKIGKKLQNAFDFFEKAFDPEGKEILIFITELTASRSISSFISRYGCEAYFRHNKELKFFERQKELVREVRSLNLDTN